MSDQRLMYVLQAPHISEKAHIAADQNRQVVFKVAKDATKPEIKAAVEKLFDVKVANVSTLNVKGKSKSHGRLQGKRKDWKKAYVTLQEGHDIDFVTGD